MCSKEINYGSKTDRSRSFFSFMTTKFSTLILKFLVSWTENPHLSFRGTDVSTFLRLFYDTFHRDRAVRQLLLTAFQYLRMRPASGWDRVRRGWTLLPFSLVTGNESDMVVRAMSDGMIKSWTRLTEGYANVEVLFRRHETGIVWIPPEKSVKRMTYINGLLQNTCLVVLLYIMWLYCTIRRKDL